jgi:glutathione S-transferase
MKLLSSGASPFVRKARVVLLETGQKDVEVVDVVSSPMGGEPALNAANPLGKIPALVREDGPTLYDSRVITRFLDARGKGGLYPDARIWETLTLEATGDAIMEAAVGITYEKRLRPAELHWNDWFEAQWAKIDRTLDALGARWMGHLHGPVDMGHISIGCALGYLDLRHDVRNWREGRDVLAAWEKAFSERPAMQATKPA